MKKKVIILISVLVVILGIFSGYFIIKENEEKKELEKTLASYSTPLLYKVSKEGSDQTIYLFGSIHLADNKAYPLPNEVMDAYNGSDYLAVEFDLIAFNKNLQAQTDMTKKMLLSDGLTIEDVLAEETYDILIPYLEENDSYNNLYDYYGPAFFYSLVSNVGYQKSGLNSTKGIDMHFLNLSKKNKKEIIEMESSDYQTNLLVSFPDELYDLLISYSINYEKESIEEINELYSAWLKGDEKILDELLSEEVDKDLATELFNDSNSIKLLEDYENKLILQRNNEMSEKINKYFNEEKDVFVVVGLGHIVGEDGIREQLREKGYAVEKVKIDKTKLREEK